MDKPDIDEDQEMPEAEEGGPGQTGAAAADAGGDNQNNAAVGLTTEERAARAIRAIGEKAKQTVASEEPAAKVSRMGPAANTG